MAMRVLPSALLGMALVVALAGTPRAAVDSPLVRAGVAAYESMQYGRAVRLLERARGGTLSEEEQIVTLKTLASAKVALGDDQGAQADFEALLRVAPGFTFDRTASPKIRLLFEEARARVLEREAAPAPVAPPPALAAPPPAQVAPAPGTPAAAPAIAVAPVVAVRKEAPAQPKPLYRKGWFWGILGGVAAAGIVAGVTAGILTRDTGGQLIVVPR